MKAKKTHVTYPVKYTVEEHQTVKRRADTAGVSIQKYVKDMTVFGKLQARKS